MDFVYDGDFSGIGIGDVFIDLVSNNPNGGPETRTWDFVLDVSKMVTSSFDAPLALGDKNDIVKTSATPHPDTTDSYILSNMYYDSGYREDHPVEANVDNLQVTDGGGFTVDGPAGGSLSFTNISGVKIGFEDFYLGFAPQCANDVVYEFIDPVPEPSTVLLLGLGLLGVAAVGRKRMKK